MTPGKRLELHASAQLGRLHLNVLLDTDVQTLVLIGPNGAGKSSILSMILGALPPQTGRITFDGETLSDSRTRTFVPIEARRIGYLPQNYGLFPHMAVRENVAFARRCANPKEPRRVHHAKVDRLLVDLGVEAFAGRMPASLSGGEQQRVALARALAASPRALLLDEPLAALDVHARLAVRTFLKGYLRALALPTIIVTHDAAEARDLGTSFAAIEGGQVTQVGTWDTLVTTPATPFIAQFVGA